jgi:hypothetical protein
LKVGAISCCWPMVNADCCNILSDFFFKLGNNENSQD